MMPSRLDVYLRKISAHLEPAPVQIPRATGCGQAVARMRAAGASQAIVVDGCGRPVGIVTEQDVCRRVAFVADAHTPVERIMTEPVLTVRSGDLLFHGIASMRRAGLRHLPVVDAGGRLAGVLRLEAALAVAEHRLLDEIDRLTRDDSPAGLRDTKAAQARVARDLLAQGAPVDEVQRLIARVNNDLYRRVVDASVAAMAAEGFGAPPVGCDVVVMGSAGREESLLYPDQDNGMVIADHGREDRAGVDAWFAELAGRMVDALADIGFARCRGDVMATSPRWRLDLSRWRRQVSGWVARGEGESLRMCDIFFDFSTVHGDGAQARALREHIRRTARGAHFLREMYRVDEAHGVALGLFGRLQRDPVDGPHKGKVNLKLTGTLPLVGAVRLLALRAGIECTGTVERMEALRESGDLSAGELDYLAGAFRHIRRLLLRQQLRDHEAGEAVGHHVAESMLSRRERDMLVAGFRAIRRFRTRVREQLGA